MSLRFILGRAGTGKTKRCLDEIRDRLRRSPEGHPLIFLVPEQATFQYEKELAGTPGLGGMMRAQVLSFRRLAWLVLQETGGSARAHIGDLGKRMILRQLLEAHHDELKAFQRAAGQPGFTDTLASTLSEMKMYCQTPESLAGGARYLREQGYDTLADKLDDLSLLQQSLQDRLAGTYTDPDDYLNLLAEQAAKSPTVRQAEFWIDGFAGFTPQEYRVLDIIMRTAVRVNVALCLDGRDRRNTPPEEGELFQRTRETMFMLRNMAAKQGIAESEPLVLDGDVPPRFRNRPALAYLEENFYNPLAQPMRGSTAAIRVVSAANRRAEVEAAAREITRLCIEENYRWRDISVVLREFSAYGDLIATVFSDYEIPYFIDQKRDVLHHPLVELLRSALEVVIKNWSYDPVFRYLKTDLVPIGREAVDLLENYVLAHGINGKLWLEEEPWRFTRAVSLEQEDDLTDQDRYLLEKVNRARDQAASALREFARGVSARKLTVREITSYLYNLLEKLGVPERIALWARRAEEEGQPETARKHNQVWNEVAGLFDELVESLGEQPMTVEEYARVLDTGLESLRLGLIPPSLDQVLVASLERSRNPNVKACFVLGVGDGVLPARADAGGIFTEPERERLETIGLKVAPGGRRRVFDEQFLVYVALTRPSHMLWLSYPLADEEGQALMPSPVIARVKELFPDLEETFYPVDPPGSEIDIEFITRPGRTLSYLAAKLREAKAGREIKDIWWSVYNWFVTKAGSDERIARVFSGLCHRNREDFIPPEVSRQIYGTPLRVSVSRIEKFRSCAFAHFLHYGLRLKDRPVQQLAAPDIGHFFHAALKAFGERVKTQGLDWAELDRAHCARLAGEIVGELTPKLQSQILLSSSRYRYLCKKLRRTVERSTSVLAEHARRGDFRPVGLELYFGPGGVLPAVVFHLADGTRMELQGQIDRIDAVKGDDGTYLRIIDYKSGTASLDLTAIFHGLKIQLLTYLRVALLYAKDLVGQEALPGGMLYFAIRDPIVSTNGPVDPAVLDKELLKSLRMKGLLLGDEKVVRLMDRNISGHSEIIPVALGKNGFYQNTPVVSREQFQDLFNHLDEVLKDSGGQIVKGIVTMNPYRRGRFKYCMHCEFKPVCHFDTLLDDNNYRIIAEEADDDIWHRMKAGKEGETGE
ncbi:MAG: helicase-exonuclease AddAB subunit AddB [Peptococcaceae bacterium]|nr:helicase-exonuclease AddAB subunit AddB [Peptococcaceae bacterium]